ncbi:MAG TPA: type IX secretion system membrane protein PorP/SprF [Bacteroidia bacterium]|nr:type IX secretion system membrane protein PorP/SprF [Bacteroidia bacterium]
MKRLLSLAAVALLATTAVFGQQDPQFSQNMFNRLWANAAYAGSSDGICATAIYRDQWSGFDGAPKTGILNIDAPVRALHGGLGLSVLAADELGAENSLNVKLSYAFRFNVGSGNLAIGADFGFLQKSLDGFSAGDYIDPNDPVIPSSSQSGSVIPDIGAGVYFNSDKLYIGASASHLTEPKVEYGDFSTVMARHYYFMAGYRLEFSPSLSLIPSVFVKNVADETQADINANLHFNNRFWVGASYRLEDAIVVMAGLNILSNLRLGYSYDITTSDLQDYSNGTHEVMLNYCFYIKKKIKPINRNVRFL